MLKNNLLNIPQIVLLRSDKIFDKLINELLGTKLKKDSFGEFFEGVRDFYPNSYRLDELELSVSSKEIKKSGVKANFDYKSFSGSDYDFCFLDDIFEQFFSISGDKVYAKNLDEYQKIITKIAPSQIVGYKLAKYLELKELELVDLKRFVSRYRPLGFDVDKKDYADNHIHLKGASYNAFNIFHLFSKPTNSAYFKKEFLQKIPRINEFSFINNHQYSMGQMVEIVKLSLEYIFGYILDEEGDKKDKYIEDIQKILVLNKRKKKYKYTIENILKMEKLFPIYGSDTKDTILREIVKHYKKGEFSQAYLMKNLLFFYLYKEDDSFLKKFIKIYFIGSNILRSYMLMSQNLGLAHFSEFSGSYIRQVNRKNADNIASGISSSGTKYLNAKLDVKSDSDNIKDVLGDFKNSFDKSDLEYSFCLSTKKEKKKEIPNTPRFYLRAKEIKKEALGLDRFLRDVKYKNINEFSYKLKYSKIKAYEDRENLKNKSFDLSSYVVAIDSVGKETHTPPEVFAPFFKYIRKQPKKLKNNIFKELVNFKHHSKVLITAHGGEDFNHIITGIRRVDECVRFFGMEDKDRVGHALSLGIEPKSWYNGISELLIYKGDYFDDLVWLVFELKEFSCDLPIDRYIKKYEDKIWKLFRDIYGDMDLKLIDLYEAWEYRENCAITYFSDKRDITLFDEYSNTVLNSIKNQNAKEIYEKYQLNQQVREKSKEVIRVDISDEELEIFEALQDYMIDRLAKKGIVIETNPSSNVFVSNINDYENHPIFRFYPPKAELLQKGARFNKYGLRDGDSLVTINSDDPAIFATSLQNEYTNIKNIAIKKYNCTLKEASDWVDDIREFGIKIFKDSYGIS